ncbi:MAG: PPC domain-containing protein [Brevundimonas sp.]|uniref:PPC domain-containing protein n=1 Tax=Brevundimonas sp. TaxID=1871086 RepID=UPI0040340F31
MRQTVLAAASALAIAAALAGAAQAQESQPLTVGASVDGVIGAEDATDQDNMVRFDAWTVPVQAGERYEAVMRSDAFDAYLEVLNDKGEVMARDDDGLGEGTNARVRFTAAHDGVWTIRARPLAGTSSGGDYTLSLAAIEAVAVRDSTSIAVGQTLTGEIGSGDAEADDGALYDGYVFDGRSDQRVLISLDSDAFDPVLRVGRVENGAFVELAMNDDGPGAGLNSRLSFTPPENGRFEIRAAPLSTGREGGYSLTLSEAPPPPQARAVRLDERVRGELSEDDAVNEGGARADAYSFTGREGQRIRIDMTSSAFDTYLELFDTNRASLATDDDSGPVGANSRLVFTLPTDGTYTIEARAFSDGTGNYSLTVSEVPPEQPPAPIAFGRAVEGEIGENDSRDAQDRGHDAFVFSGTEGQRIQVIMRSGDFDTYLQIGRPGEEFTALSQDDDGLGEGTDSRLRFTLPETGDYVLRASPLGSEGKGLYSLELTDRGPQPVAGSLLVGTTARGELTETDATAENNSVYDAYRVTLKEGEELIILMVSNEVDSMVSIGHANGDDFDLLAADDDGLSDTHAKLEWTAPDDGEYEIRAGTYAQGQTGSYALIVDKKP